MTDYKSYQQVLSIGVKRNGATPKKVTKPKTQCADIKRRTKTGCLTCRKRKKKCDEDRVNGKCQGCTRNFLECCWPEEHAEIKLADSVPSTPKLSVASSPSPVPDLVQPPVAKLQVGKCSIESMLATPIHLNPYPSPIQSPISEVKLEEKEVQFLALPPLAFKQAAKQSAVREQPAKQSKFIITSFNTDNDLCQVI